MSTPKAFKGITPPERGSGSRSSRNFGVFLAILAVLISAPDGCLLRSIQVRGGGKNLNLQIFALKFLMAAPMQLCWVLYERGVNVCWRGTCSCWQWVILGSLFTVGAALVTIANLESTSVSALLFFYVAPLWALVMGVFYMQEALQRRTVVAVVIACAGVGLLFVPSFLHRILTQSWRAPMQHGMRPAYGRHTWPILGNLHGRVRQTLRLRTTFCPCSSREADMRRRLQHRACCSLSLPLQFPRGRLVS